MKTRKLPQRKCLGCNTVKAKQDLVRIVRSPQGEVLLDRSGKKPGRGAYVCPEDACIVKAITGKSLEKSLGIAISEEVKKALLEELKNEK